MEVDREELIQVLNQLKPGISSKEFLEQSTHFILNTEEILSYNGDISVVCPFNIGVECTVDASIFYKLISRMKKSTITIELKKTKLVLECGTIKSDLPIVVDSKIFAFINKLGDEQDKLEWNPLPKNFLDAVELCAFSASTDKTLGTFTCIWVEGSDVLSTDKYRASWYKMDEAVKKDFYVEAALISELLKFAVPKEVCLSDSWAHFLLADETVFTTRLVQPGELLPLRDKFNEFKHDARIPLPNDLTSAVETVAITVEGDEKLDQLVSIEFGEDLIRCVGHSQRGTIEEEIHLDKPLKIDPFTIQASPISLLAVLEKSTHLLVGEEKAVFKSREAKGFQHIMGIIKE